MKVLWAEGVRECEAERCVDESAARCAHIESTIARRVENARAG